MTKDLGYHDDETDEFIVIPHTWDICYCCNGEGTSSAYLGSFSMEELSDKGPEWQDDYFGGAFDRDCEPCEGTGKLKVPDFSRMSEEAKAAYLLERQIEREMEAEAAAERRWGA